MRIQFDDMITDSGNNSAAVTRDVSFRGLKVLLLEAYDFAYGCIGSLIHGGVGFLKAVQMFTEANLNHKYTNELSHNASKIVLVHPNENLEQEVHYRVHN